LHELDQALLSFRGVFFQVGGFSFVINMLMLAPAIYMMSVYDRVMTGRNEFTLLFMTLLVLGAFTLMGVLEWVRSRLLVRVGTRLDAMMRDRIFVAAFERNLKRAGGNPAQAMNDLSSVRQFVTGNGILAFFDAPWIPIFMVVIALIHPVLGLFSVGAAAILFVLALLNEVYTRTAIDEAQSQSVAANLYANNNLRNAEVIEAMGMMAGIRRRWEARHDKSLSLQALASDRGGLIQAITKVCRIAFQSLILGLAAWLAIRGDISAGGLIGAMVLMSRTLAPVEHLIGVWRQWVGSRASYARLKQLLVEFPSSDHSMALPPPRGAVTVESASVVAPGTEVAILKGLGFSISAGDVVGVIGPSGAGKSTLARVLVGVWPASSGHARLDGADIAAWDKTELGPYLGYLPQDIELFEGSVAENICRFGEIDSERIVRAAVAAGVHDLILHLPNGYDTPIGVDGSALSGGQRQRIALARALYGDPVLLVLDEPNSNLDESGEAALLAAIRQTKALGHTVVLVSHRGSLLPVIDKLLVLRDGGLVAYGPRDQVLAYLQAQQQPVQPQGESAASGNQESGQ
jgi:ATP-binding cassette subfamily C exporter for protease/lipase